MHIPQAEPSVATITDYAVLVWERIGNVRLVGEAFVVPMPLSFTPTQGLIVDLGSIACRTEGHLLAQCVMWSGDALAPLLQLLKHRAPFDYGCDGAERILWNAQRGEFSVIQGGKTWVFSCDVLGNVVICTTWTPALLPSS